MIALILAAGNNTRIAGDTHYPSKVLIPIGGKSLLLRNMDLLSDHVDRFVIVVGRAEDEIRREINRSSYSDRTEFVRQDEATGTLDAVRLAMPYVHGDVFLVLGDEFLIHDRIDGMIDAFNDGDADVVVGIIPDSDEFFIKEAYTLHYDGRFVDRFIEKPEVVFNRDRGTGYYIIDRKVLNLLPDIDPGKKDIIDLFNHALENSCRILSFHVAQEEYNINTALQLNRAIESFEHNLH